MVIVTLFHIFLKEITIYFKAFNKSLLHTHFLIFLIFEITLTFEQSNNKMNE
jgi:hypothetical protein